MQIIKESKMCNYTFNDENDKEINDFREQF